MEMLKPMINASNVRVAPRMTPRSSRCSSSALELRLRSHEPMTEASHSAAKAATNISQGYRVRFSMTSPIVVAGCQACVRDAGRGGHRPGRSHQQFRSTRPWKARRIYLTYTEVQVPLLQGTMEYDNAPVPTWCCQANRTAPPSRDEMLLPLVSCL